MVLGAQELGVSIEPDVAGGGRFFAFAAGVALVAFCSLAGAQCCSRLVQGQTVGTCHTLQRLVAQAQFARRRHFQDGGAVEDGPALEVSGA